MTPQQAIQFLDEILSQVNAPRSVHVQIAEAVETIKQATKAE